MSHSTRVKPPPTADDLREMMEAVETLRDELERVQRGVQTYDFAAIPAIGEYGRKLLNKEIDKARAAIEWLGIIIGDAEKDAMDGPAPPEPDAKPTAPDA